MIQEYFTKCVKGGKDMRIMISGKNMEVSEYLKGLVEKKSGKIKKVF